MSDLKQKILIKAAEAWALENTSSNAEYVIAAFLAGHAHALEGEAVKALVERLNAIRSHDRLRGYPTGGEWMQMVNDIRDTLAAFEKTKAGGTEESK